MISLRNVLPALVFLSICVEFSIAAEVVNSAQPLKSTESCEASSPDYYFGKGFLEDFRINTDEFESLPEDVKCFVEVAANCEHYAGEPPYDAKRARQVSAGVRKYCSLARKKFKALKIKYKTQAEIQRVLSVCELSEGYSQYPTAVCTGTE